MTRPAAAVGLIVLGLTLATVRGSFGGGQDEEIVFVQTASLVRHRDLAFDTAEVAEVAAHTGLWRDALVPAQDGRHYAVYGPAQALAATPLYLAGSLAARLTGGGRATVVRWVGGFNPLVTALTAALLCLWLLALDLGRPVALATSLGWALATLAWPYAKTFLAEPLAAGCLLAAAAAAWQAGRTARGGWAWVAGLALAFAGLSRPHNLMLAPVVVLAGRRGLLGALLPSAVVAGWWLWFNQVRFGAPLDFGYLAAIQSDFRLANVPVGLVGQLVSPGRGLVWYAPPAVLALWGAADLRRRDARLAWVLVGLVAWQGVFYSLRSTWWGNWCWGPRYFVPVLPLLAVVAAPALAQPRLRWLAAALAGLGVVNAMAGLVLYNGLYQDLVFRAPDGLAKLLWSPAWSPLVGHWRELARQPVDLLLWQAARVDPVFALAAGLVRLAPALLGLGLLRAPRTAAGGS